MTDDSKQGVALRERLRKVEGARATIERLGGRWLAPGVTVRAFELDDEAIDIRRKLASGDGETT